MKIQVGRTGKGVGVIAGILFVIVGSIYICQGLFNHYVETTVANQSSYLVSPVAQYQVNIYSNNFFDKTILPEDTGYIKKLVETVPVVLGVKFQGGDKSSSTVDYKIKLCINGVKETDGVQSVIWHKDKILSDVSGKKYTDDFLIKESHQIDLAQYQKIADEAVEELGISLTTYVRAEISGTIHSQIQETPYEIPFESYVQIPLNEDYFTISKSENTEITNQNNEASENTKRVKTTDNRAVLQGSVITALGMACILFFTVFTKNLTKEEFYRRKSEKLILSQKSRMVEMTAENVVGIEKEWKLSSLSALVRVADELRCPVFYIRAEDHTILNNRFFIMNGEVLYGYDFSHEVEETIPRKWNRTVQKG